MYQRGQKQNKIYSITLSKSKPQLQQSEYGQEEIKTEVRDHKSLESMQQHISSKKPSSLQQNGKIISSRQIKSSKGYQLKIESSQTAQSWNGQQFKNIDVQRIQNSKRRNQVLSKTQHFQSGKHKFNQNNLGISSSKHQAQTDRNYLELEIDPKTYAGSQQFVFQTSSYEDLSQNQYDSVINKCKQCQIFQQQVQIQLQQLQQLESAKKQLTYQKQIELEYQKKDHFNVISQFKAEISRLEKELADKRNCCDQLYEDNQKLIIQNQNLKKIIQSLQINVSKSLNSGPKNESDQVEISDYNALHIICENTDQLNPSLISSQAFTSPTCPIPQQTDVINTPIAMQFTNSNVHTQQNDFSPEGKGPKLISLSISAENKGNQLNEKIEQCKILLNTIQNQSSNNSSSKMIDLKLNNQSQQIQKEEPNQGSLKQNNTLKSKQSKKQNIKTNVICKNNKVNKKNDQCKHHRILSNKVESYKIRVKQSQDDLTQELLSNSLSFSKNDPCQDLQDLGSQNWNRSLSKSHHKSQQKQEQFHFIQYKNGDFQSISPEGVAVYYYSNTKTTMTTLQDGTNIILFSTGQQEVYNTDKTKLIKYPDGSVKVININGVENFYSPEENIQITDAQQIRITEFSSNRKDFILPDKSIIRIFPNSLAKFISIGKRVYTTYIKNK